MKGEYYYIPLSNCQDTRSRMNNFIRPTRRQAIATGVITSISTLLANGKSVTAQQDANSGVNRNPYDDVSFPEGFTRGTTNIGDIELHHVTGGNPDASAVLLWHGFLGNGYSNRKLLPLLANDFNLVCPDMRGYGASTHPGVKAAYDGQTLANDFKSLMKQLGHDRYHIIAHDMGAPAALLMTADSPEQIISLTYMEEPTALPDILSQKIRYTEQGTNLGGLWWWMMAYAEGMAEAIISGNERPFVDWFYNNYTATSSAIDEQARRVYVRDFEGAEGIAGWFGVYRDMLTTVDQTIPLASSKIQTPVLAIGGANSLGATVAEQIRQVAQNVEESVIENCGHFIPEEKPEELANLFRNFSSRL